MNGLSSGQKLNLEHPCQGPPAWNKLKSMSKENQVSCTCTLFITFFFAKSLNLTYVTIFNDSWYLGQILSIATYARK